MQNYLDANGRLLPEVRQAIAAETGNDPRLFERVSGLVKTFPEHSTEAIETPDALPDPKLEMQDDPFGRASAGEQGSRLFTEQAANAPSQEQPVAPRLS